MKPKKYLLPSTLSALALTGSALAADFTITANLSSGTSILDLNDANKTVTLTPGTPVADHHLTTLQVYSNNVAGYTVKLRSLKGSKLEDASSNQIVYSFKYNNATYDLSGMLDVTVEDTTTTTGGVSLDRQVHISVAAAELDGKPSGNTYTDTITFQIVAK